MRSTVALLAALLVSVLLAGCERDEPPADQVKGMVTVASGTSPEARLIGAMYGLALRKAGYRVTDRTGMGERGVFLGALRHGEVDVVTDDLAGVTGWFDAEVNGPAAAAAKPVASGDRADTLAGLQRLLNGSGLSAGRLSLARRQVAFAVTKELADREELRTVSDLVKLDGQLVLGGPADCPADPNCLPGLRRVYGVTVEDFRPLGAVSSAPVLDALEEDTVQVGTVLSSGGGVAEKNLVVLEDDRGMQPAGNLLAVYRNSVPVEARTVVEKVNQALTTEKLQELNKKLDPDGADPEDLAKMFLRDAGLV